MSTIRGIRAGLAGVGRWAATTFLRPPSVTIYHRDANGIVSDAAARTRS